MTALSRRLSTHPDRCSGRGTRRSPLLISADGSETTSFEYSDYGVLADQIGLATIPIGFTGNQTDPDTELVYLRARDCDPATGQFMQVDPALGDTHQPYTYAFNNPVRSADPTGLGVGMDNTPQDRVCTANDFYWADFWPSVADSAAPSLAGLADGVTGGLTHSLRESQGGDCYVDKNGWYWFEFGLG